jgi:endonuclease YncB( thermonuclease family)
MVSMGFHRCILRGVAVSLLLGVAAVTASPPVASAEAFQPRVFRVFDGDRFLVRERGRTMRIQVAGVDAPELDQPHGPESKAILEQMVSGKRVALELTGQTDGDYQVARVRWGDFDIGAELVRVGAAWAAPPDGPADAAMADLETAARDARRGLWSLPAPVPPREWRARSDDSPG